MVSLDTHTICYIIVLLYIICLLGLVTSAEENCWYIDVVAVSE